MKAKAQKIIPHLWYTKDAEEAAQFYARVFPDSRIDRVTSLAADSGVGPEGSVVVVEFTLLGQSFMAMNAGKNDPFNEAISLLVKCDTQDEIDRYWNALLENGGKAGGCGWIADKYGVRWQIVPSTLMEMIAAPDKKKAARVSAEMLNQVKFDIAKLTKAFEGR